MTLVSLRRAVQIALFFDELSAATMPLDSRLDGAGRRTIGGDHTLHNSSLGLAAVGASFTHYYLSDLAGLDVEPAVLSVVAAKCACDASALTILS